MITHISEYQSTKVPADLLERFQEMPKVELHVHIEGATAPEVYWEMSKKNQVQLPFKNLNDWKNFFAFKDFNHFIEVYQTSVSTLKSADDYYELIYNFVLSQGEQNILWTEAFMSLSLLPKMKRGDFLNAIAQALADAHSKVESRVAIIGDIARHMPETQEEVLSLVLEGYKMGVFIGLGLGGIESGFPPQIFEKTWQRARSAGLVPHAHAGETTGPQTIQDTVDLLKSVRIGHGIKIVDDPSMAKKLSHLKVPFEVCPQSNYATRVVPRGKPHPIREMMNLGIFCTVNSDDPAMFSTSLANEYSLLAGQGFTWDELWQLNLNAIEASCQTESAKQKLREKFTTYAASTFQK